MPLSPASEASSTLEVDVLQQELQATQRQLQQVQQQLLDERKQRRGDSQISSPSSVTTDSAHEEDEQLLAARLRHELNLGSAERNADLQETCDALRKLRDALAADCRTIIHQATAEATLTLPFQHQLDSLQRDIEQAQKDMHALEQARDELIQEMIMINSKNAQLTEMSNDLTRALSEREKEALAVMNGTNFLDERQKAQRATTVLAMDTKRSSSLDRLFKKKRNLFKRYSSSSEEILSPLSAASASTHAHTQTHAHTLPPPPPPAVPPKSPTTETEEEEDDDFVTTRVLKPSRCEICQDMMWRRQDLEKCRHCQAVCHTQCIRGRHSCQRRPVFGTPLVLQFKREQCQIPCVVRVCIDAVEARGMDFEGLYRKSGGSNIMRELQAVFDKGQIPDLFDDKWGDICSVTSTLKMYFRELPDPLFTYQAHAQFMRAAALADRNNHIIPRLHGLLHALPEAHFAVISYLMKHLDRVQQHQEYNLMNRKNLALVFGPTLLRNQDDNADLTEMNLKIKIVDLILEHYDQLLL